MNQAKATQPDFLFDGIEYKAISFENVLNEVKSLSCRIVRDMDIPEGSITTRRNAQKSGKTVYSLCVCEPQQNFHHLEGYPRITPFLKIIPPLKTLPNEVRLELSVELFERLAPPSGAESEKRSRKEKKTRKETRDDGTKKIVTYYETTYYYRITFNLSSPTLLKYIECVARSFIENYKSIEPWFGCCHRYVKCSDARKCLHPNRLYSTVCSYRGNIEKGQIFYGKNKQKESHYA